jgi:hypothetical protein
MADAPIPLCPQHVRLVFEYAQAVMDSRWEQTLQAAREAQAIAAAPSLPPPSGDNDGWVYFIRKGDEIKIGFSSCPAARFKVLRPDEVLHLEPGGYADERRVHAAFADSRLHGEWFRQDPQLMAFIADLRSKAAA